jgi:hypothetical protein
LPATEAFAQVNITCRLEGRGSTSWCERFDQLLYIIHSREHKHQPVSMSLKSLSLLAASILFSLCTLSSALPNATCAATGECRQEPSVMTVSPVFSAALSPLDEVMLSAFGLSDSPSMQPAQFPVFYPAKDQTVTLDSLVLSADSFAAYLPTESEGELGMF